MIRRMTGNETDPRDRGAQALADRIYEDIVVGAHPLGGRLVEGRLVERYGAKRHALREALARLEEMALIDRLPNRGAQVRELTPKAMREIYALRLLLETEAARITPLPASGDVVAALNAVQDRHSAALRNGDLRAVLRFNAAFHRTQFGCCGNDTLSSLAEDLARRTHPVTILKFPEPRVAALIEAQHRAIADAMAGSDRDALVAAVRAHFDHARLDAYAARWIARHGIVEEGADVGDEGLSTILSTS